MLSHLFNKDSVVGIDIGSSCIKAIQLEPDGDGWRIVNAAIQQTPADSCHDGVITSVLDVAQSIRSLLRSANITCNQAVAAISGSQVIVRQVQFPKMSETLLRKSIRFEAARYVSAPIEDSVVEFEILGDIADSEQMNVMLVAAPQELVDSRVSVIQAAGLEPVAIDVEAFAIIRSLAQYDMTGEFLNRAVALVDMGATHTDVNIVTNGMFALTRSIPIAGDSFTNAIKAMTGLTCEEAENLKCQMAAAEPPIETISSQEVSSNAWRVVQPLLDELLREIRRSVHFYQSQFPEGSEQTSVSKIILSGGTSRMPGMAAYVESKLSIPAEVRNPFSGQLIDPGKFSGEFIDEYGPMFVVGTGLALKEQPVQARLSKAA